MQGSLEEVGTTSVISFDEFEKEMRRAFVSTDPQLLRSIPNMYQKQAGDRVLVSDIGDDLRRLAVLWLRAEIRWAAAMKLHTDICERQYENGRPPNPNSAEFQQRIETIRTELARINIASGYFMGFLGRIYPSVLRTNSWEITSEGEIVASKNANGRTAFGTGDRRGAPDGVIVVVGSLH